MSAILNRHGGSSRPSMIQASNINSSNSSQNYNNVNQLPAQQTRSQSESLNIKQLPHPIQRYSSKYGGSMQGSYEIYKRNGTHTILDPFEKRSYQIDGCSSYNMLHPVTESIPMDSSTSETFGLPVAFHVSPLAELNPGELDIPIVRTGIKGPIRCHHCALYLHSRSKIDSINKTFHCDQCNNITKLTDEQCADYDNYGHLIQGHATFEYLIEHQGFAPIIREGTTFTNEKLRSRLGYRKNDALGKIPVFRILAIQTSKFALVSGAITAVCQGVAQALDSLEDNVRLGLICFDSQISCFDFNPERGSDTPVEVICADVDNPCAVLSAFKFCRPVSEIREKIRQFLHELPDYIAQRYDYIENTTVTNHSCLGSALECLHQILGIFGGAKISAFICGSDTCGIGKTANTSASSMLPQKENLMDVVRNKKTFWEILAEKFLDSHLSLDVIAAGPHYCDLVCVTKTCQYSNGKVKFYEKLSSELGSLELIRNDFYTLFSTPCGYSATLRARCSKGLSLDSWIGNVAGKELSVLNEASPVNIDASTSLCFKLRFEERLENGKVYFVQVACLYTHPDGSRRVRLLHHYTKAINGARSLFLCVDDLALVSYFTKFVLSRPGNPESYRNKLFQHILKPLFNYRNEINTSATQKVVVFPLCLQYSVLYTHMVLHQACMISSSPSDHRAASKCSLLGLGVEAFASEIVPIIYDMTNPSEDWLTLDEMGNIRFPPMYRQTATLLPDVENSVLLFTSNSKNYLFVGKNIDIPVPSGFCTEPYYNSFVSFRSASPLILIRQSEHPELFSLLYQEDSSPEVESHDAFLKKMHNAILSRVDYM